MPCLQKTAREARKEKQREEGQLPEPRFSHLEQRMAPSQCWGIGM